MTIPADTYYYDGNLMKNPHILDILYETPLLSDNTPKSIMEKKKYKINLYI